MTNGFEIKVPITIKGGKEGDKVGKQIGEKIAAQLKNVFKSVKIGGAPGIGTGPSGMLGVTKGLKGVATKLGVVGVAIAAAVGILSKASPYLKGILDIFGRAFMIFFRPFGDFLATLLRPMAILMMRMAVAFLKWTRPIVGAGAEGAEKAPQLGAEVLGVGKIGTALTNTVNFLLRLGGSIGQIIFEIGRSLFEVGGKIGQWIYDAIIKPLSEFGGKIGQWIYDKVIKPAADWISGIITNLFNFEWAQDFGTWLWNKLTGLFENLGDSLSGLGMWLWDKITSAISGIFTKDRPGLFRLIFPKRGEGQTGISSVPGDGLYQLHRGEEVIPRTKVGGNKSIVLKPTFQFSGNVSSETDVDEIARRAGRIIQMELKQRGVL